MADDWCTLFTFAIVLIVSHYLSMHAYLSGLCTIQ